MPSGVCQNQNGSTSNVLSTRVCPPFVLTVTVHRYFESAAAAGKHAHNKNATRTLLIHQLALRLMRRHLRWAGSVLADAHVRVASFIQASPPSAIVGSTRPARRAGR